MDLDVARLDPGLVGRDARPITGIDNGFLAAYRVRFDEAGADGLIRTSALLRYAQDVAWRHSEALGFDREWYASRGLGWVVRGLDLRLVAPISMGQTLRVSTAVVGHRRIWARRLAECRGSDGTLAAAVTTDWVLLDGRGRVVRIPPDFGVAFTNPEVKAEIVRVAAHDGPEAGRLALDVRTTELDPVGHVNNAVYLDWIEEALASLGWPSAATAVPRTCRLEYAASATAADRVDVVVRGTPADWFAAVVRVDGLELVRASGGMEGPTEG